MKKTGMGVGGGRLFNSMCVYACVGNSLVAQCTVCALSITHTAKRTHSQGLCGSCSKKYQLSATPQHSFTRCFPLSVTYTAHTHTTESYHFLIISYQINAGLVFIALIHSGLAVEAILCVIHRGRRAGVEGGEVGVGLGRLRVRGQVVSISSLHFKQRSEPVS